MANKGNKEVKLNTILSGIAGEYFAAAELSRHGLIAAVTLRNTSGADIFASKVNGKRALTIQVKTRQGRGGVWTLSKGDEVNKGPLHFYVFVALNGRDGTPEYHICPGEFVSDDCRRRHQDYLAGKDREGRKRKDTKIRQFKPEGRNWLDRWDLLEKALA